MSVSLGGFKFVGYKYVIPENYDSTDEEQTKAELLKMHKCKLKAFTEANALSGSSWAFSQTSGEYSYGTYGNVIYSLGTTVGLNLFSFLRHGSDNAYYCIATLGNASTSSGEYSLQLNNFYSYYESGTRYHTVIGFTMSCSGIEEITPLNVNVVPETGRLPLSAIDPTTYSGATGTTVSGLPGADLEYGYAIKGKTIICISHFIGNTYYNCKIDCIDGMTLCSPNDHANIFCFTATIRGTSNSSTTYTNSVNFLIITLRGDGRKYENNSTTNAASKGNTILIPPPQKAISLYGSDNTPYEGAFITPGFARTMDLTNADGIVGKGTVSVDILAVNNIVPSSNISVWQTYANGNYLLIHYYYNTGTINNNYHMFNRFIYCGWDPSNPDITVDASWPAYTG